MNTAAIYHRTESEYAYLYTNELMHVRLRTARADCKNVSLVHGDPYELEKKRWYKQPSAMRKHYPQIFMIIGKLMSPLLIIG